MLGESWRRGDLDYKRHEGQRLLTEAVEASPYRTTILHAARGYGKTYSALLDHVEYGLQEQNYGHRQLFAAATREDAKKIVAAVMPMVLAGCPAAYRPVWRSSDHLYEFPKGLGQFIIEGADDDGGDHLRGPHIHRFTGDEVAFWRDPIYAYRSVILPQLQRVGGKGRLQSSSPKSVGHGFVGLCEEAIRKGGYHKFTVWDNPRLTKEQIQSDAEEMSGLSGDAVWKNTAVRRELLCEFVTDETRAVIPEFNEQAHVVDDYTLPEWTDTYTFLDLGLIDLTHALFAHYDFARAKLVIEDEIAVQYEKTSDFAAKCMAKERTLWSKLPYYGHVSAQSYNRAPYGRYSDNDPQILFDLAGMGLVFAPALKVEKEAALNRLRLAFSQGRIEIHARCKTLIHQLKVGIFKERREAGYERLGGMAGHLDGIDALIYGWRMMNHNRNPIPPLLGVTPGSHHVPKGLADRIKRENTMAWPVRK